MGNPSTTTRQHVLTACGNRCAFPDCDQPIFDKCQIGEICHIKGNSPDSVRYDESQSEEERQSFSNLIVMCRKHHKIIDNSEKQFTVKILCQWKKDHESKIRRQSQPVVPSMGYLAKVFKWIDKVYVAPLEFEEILKTLEEKRIVLITGTPEYGKTFTAIYLMWKYDKLGYSPEWIQGGVPTERLNVRSRLQKMTDLELESETKKILYFEDPFGKLKYEERNDLERKITSIFEEIKNIKDLYVIITSREEVFKEFKKKAFSGAHLEAFEKRLSIGKPSYTPEKRKKILTNWATFKKCMWLNNEELKKFVLDQIENENILPTPLNIRDFVVANININSKEQLLTEIKDKSGGTPYEFLKEIKEMTNDKVLFLTILYVLEYAREEFVKETYQNLILRLNLENIRKFIDVFNWFKDDKIEITSQNTIKFSHPSYFEAMKDLISEGDDYNIIFIELLKYLAGKDEASRDVAYAITENFNELPENVREQLLLTLAEKDDAARDVAYAIAANFNELPENVREQLILTLAGNDEADGAVAFVIAKNFNELPENIKQILFTLAEKDEAARDVAYAISANFNELPEKVRQILFTLDENEETTWAVCYAIAESFDELPENVREQLLLTLADEGEAAWAVAYVITKNFNELPEKVRQILFTLSEKDEATWAVTSAIAKNFDKLPENVREQLLLTLAEKDDAARDVIDNLPEIIRNELLLNLSNIKSAQKIVANILKLRYNQIPEPLRKEIKNRLKIKDEED